MNVTDLQYALDQLKEMDASGELAHQAHVTVQVGNRPEDDLVDDYHFARRAVGWQLTGHPRPGPHTRPRHVPTPAEREVEEAAAELLAAAIYGHVPFLVAAERYRRTVGALS